MSSLKQSIPEMYERVAELNTELETRIERLKPLLSRRDELNGPYRHHAKIASDAWNAGDKKTWLEHKKIRDSLNTPERKEVYDTIAEIKDSNIPLILEMNKLNREIDKAEGRFYEYEGNRLGTSTKTITFPDNTPEWHAQRAKGIGGSDIGAIMGTSPYNGREDIFKLKTGQVQPEPKDSMSGALARGSAWEDHIAREFAKRNTHLKLVHSKSSWQNDDRAYQLANLDGLLYELDSETPDAILEIKTSSVPGEWNDAPPLYYRQQVLWYMDTFGIKRAYLAVMIDEHDYRQFEIAPVDGEMEEIHAEVAKFVEEVEEYKTNKERYEYIRRHQVNF